VKEDGSQNIQLGTYFDVSNGGTDIEFTANSVQCLLRDCVDTRLQSISNSGTLNSWPTQYRVQEVLTSGVAVTKKTYNGTNAIPFEIMEIGETLANDGTFQLPDGTCGEVAVRCGNEYGRWHVKADRTCTKLYGSTNTASDGSASKLSVYDTGSHVLVINRLGVSYKTSIDYRYYT
jgi:hypothetical protein